MIIFGTFYTNKVSSINAKMKLHKSSLCSIFHRKPCAVFSLILVLYQLFICSEAYYLDNNPYRHKQIIGPKGSYSVEWSVNWKERAITFQISARTKGWLGFGLSRDGRMSDSDLVIGGISPHGKPYFDDAHVTGNRSIKIDRQQDWTLIGAWEKGKRTYLTIRRPLETCDPDDLPIKKDLIVLIWAYGVTDDVQYHMKRRGATPIYLLDPEISDEIAHSHYRQIGPHSNLYLVQTWALTNVLHLQPKPTTVWCSIQRGPKLLARHDIVGMGAYLPTKLARRHVQQMRVFKCTSPQQTDAQSFFETYAKSKGEECYLNDKRTLPLGFCRELLYVTGRGGKPFYFPEQIGIPIGESQFEYYLLETTYDNPRTEPNLEIEAGVEIIFSHRQKQFSASLIQVGYGTFGTFLIPPKSVMNVYGSCGPRCTSSMFPKTGVKVFAAMLQTRSLGKSVALQHFRENEELKWILKDDNYDSEFQQMRLLHKDVTLLPGDQITTNCKYNSWGRNRTSFSGFSQQDEICSGYMYISTRIPFFRCTSEYPAEKLLSRYGIQNFTWDLTWQERYVTEPRQLEGTWLGDLIDHESQAHSLNVDKLQKDYRYNPHLESCPSIGDVMSHTQNKMFLTHRNEWRMENNEPVHTETPYLSSVVSYPDNVREYHDAPYCHAGHEQEGPLYPSEEVIRRPDTNLILPPTRRPPSAPIPHSHNYHQEPPPSTQHESHQDDSFDDLSIEAFENLFLKNLEHQFFKPNRNPLASPLSGPPKMESKEKPDPGFDHEINPKPPHPEVKKERIRIRLRPNSDRRKQNNNNRFRDEHQRPGKSFNEPSIPLSTLPTPLQYYDEKLYNKLSDKPNLSEEFFSFPASKPTSKPAVEQYFRSPTKRPSQVSSSAKQTLGKSVPIQGQKPYIPEVLRRPSFKGNEQFHKSVENPLPTPSSPKPPKLPQSQPYIPEVYKRPISFFEQQNQLAQKAPHPLSPQIVHSPNLDDKRNNNPSGGPVLSPVKKFPHSQQPYIPQLLKRPIPYLEEEQPNHYSTPEKNPPVSYYDEVLYKPPMSKVNSIYLKDKIFNKPSHSPSHANLPEQSLPAPYTPQSLKRPKFGGERQEQEHESLDRDKPHISFYDEHLSQTPKQDPIPSFPEHDSEKPQRQRIPSTPPHDAYSTTLKRPYLSAFEKFIDKEKATQNTLLRRPQYPPLHVVHEDPHEEPYKTSIKQPTPTPPLPSIDEHIQKVALRKPAVHYSDKVSYKTQVRPDLDVYSHENEHSNQQKSYPKSVLNYLDEHTTEAPVTPKPYQKPVIHYSDDIAMFQQDSYPSEQEEKKKYNSRERIKIKTIKPQNANRHEDAILSHSKSHVNNINSVRGEDNQNFLTRPRVYYSDGLNSQHLASPIHHDHITLKQEEKPLKVLKRPTLSVQPMFIEKIQPAKVRQSEELISKRIQKTSLDLLEDLPKTSTKSPLPVEEKIVPTLPPTKQVSKKQKFDLKNFLKNSIFNKPADITIPLIQSKSGEITVKDNQSVFKFFEQLANLFSPKSKSVELEKKEILKTLGSAESVQKNINSVQMSHRRSDDNISDDSRSDDEIKPKKATSKPTTNNLKLLILQQSMTD